MGDGAEREEREREKREKEMIDPKGENLAPSEDSRREPSLRAEALGGRGGLLGGPENGALPSDAMGGAGSTMATWSWARAIEETGAFGRLRRPHYA